MFILHVYVDDIRFGDITDSLCKEFVDLMRSEFEMSMIGELIFFARLENQTVLLGYHYMVREKHKRTTQKV